MNPPGLWEARFRNKLWDFLSEAPYLQFTIRAYAEAEESARRKRKGKECV